jgi:iron complex transport system permease protein
MTSDNLTLTDERIPRHFPVRELRLTGWRFSALLAGLTGVLVLAILFAVSIGAVAIPLAITAQVIGSHLLPTWVTPVVDPTQDQIIWVFRLPRALLAVIVGAALAVTGTVLQAVARNPLADPYLFGISSGASVGAVAVLTLGRATLGGLSLSGAAFWGAERDGAGLSAGSTGRASSMRLVLAG